MVRGSLLREVWRFAVRVPIRLITELLSLKDYKHYYKHYQLDKNDFV